MRRAVCRHEPDIYHSCIITGHCISVRPFSFRGGEPYTGLRLQGIEKII
ncbi:hypothetical protein HMPREF0080_00451 [Anaeroglobus geminatus F0357]|uniref:Uncharacterized protein n=1 Tax=Anaeroglobus geminatus F0357 TaxID=861450 RepID=G9YFN9_9FIRM|nr:hypothetical protein HMPREF0080_00451 [Anaeroglobus geminatus F0357]